MAVAIPSKVSKVVDIFVSIAAAGVIWGALQKILHTPSADLWLKIGLGTEAVVFLVYGVLYMIYPAVSDPEMDEVLTKEEKEAASGPKGNPALKTMEKMLADADITPANLTKLSAGFQKLGTTVTNMSDVGDIVKATGDYTSKTQAAAAALDKVKDAYTNTANSLASFNEASESTKLFHGQVQVLTKNLSSLNTIYELELQESNNHLKALNNFYGKLAQTSQAMEGSVEDAKKAQEQIGKLASNLGRLNQVYGNMLSAMQGR
jgi:gliding motility-associated protein GldL